MRRRRAGRAATASAEVLRFAQDDIATRPSQLQDSLAIGRFVLHNENMPPVSMGRLELMLLLAVARLGEDAYGLAIRRDVAERIGREYSVGAIYTTLERLQAKGLLTSRSTAPTPTRGGRSRRLFTVTTAGRRAIRDAQQMTASVWSGIAKPLPGRA